MKSIALAAVLAGATACGGSTVSNKEYADSTQDIAAAEQANQQLEGMENTDAALYIRLAKESVAKADKLIADGDGEQAEYYLKMAKADAQVAKALAKKDAKMMEVKAVDEKIEELRSTSLN